ncbi:MAG: Wzz/FepE/Etk N-terminal domain-containing protein [Gemmobacter sp.]
MGQIQSIDEFLGLLLRRRLVIAAVTVLGAVLALLYALSRPVIYEAAAVIQVQSPTVSDAASPVASASAQRLQTIQQRLTTRENLLAMIDRHGLYTNLPISNDEKVHMLRTQIRFQTVAAATTVTYGSAPPVSAVIIFAQADAAAKAARIANDIAQNMLDAGAETQSGRAQEALSFFADEERRVAAQLAALESEVAAYKNQNGDALPALRDMRREEIVGIEADLRGIEGSLAALSAERAAITASGRTLRETDRRQIEALSGQIDTLTAQRDSLFRQRERLVTAMALMPEVERALAGYDRRLDQLRVQYEQVTRRLAEADTAAKLEERQQSERFSLLERAVTPEYPVTGGRRKLAMVGAVVSLLLGVGVAFLLDLLHPVIRTSDQMERQLGLRPVVAIPDMRHLRPTRAEAAPARKGGGGPGWDSGARGLPRYAALFGGVALLLALAAALA